MAIPIAFKPEPVDPHLELMQRVENAPREHAEALLVAWDLLQTAHDQGILDLMQGLVGGRDVISGKLAEMMKSEDGVRLLRNMIALGRVVASIDPDMLQRLGKALDAGAAAHEKEEKAPGLLEIFRRVRSEDSRRGLSFATHMLSELGRATRGSGE
ncbi:MAG TPA: DUF1641 domain-containing protein [Acidobacteriaceae bacterium]|jgi:uncharacterized protein YjgD (DUF1641 family)